MRSVATVMIYPLGRNTMGMGMVILLTTFLISPDVSKAQWEVPTSIILDGELPEQRQIIGLADPVSGDAAVSVDAFRRQVVNRAMATGDSILVADLFPAFPAYVTGMVVTITPSVSNRNAPLLQLNGLEPRPIVKWGGIPLDSADLHPGTPARFVFDGGNFQLLGSTTINCPPEYTVGGPFYCIEDSSREAATFYQAIRTCADMGGRLCSFTEWTQACLQNPSFFDTVPEAEWLDHGANHELSVKVVGHGENGIVAEFGSGCTYATNRAPNLTARYRCCMSR